MIDITDIEALREEEYIINDVDHIATNGSYGHMSMLRKYAGLELSSRVNVAMEHGYYTDDYVYLAEVYHPCKRLITMSPYRKAVIERLTECKGISIGPYIAYAQDYYSPKKLHEIKKQWNKVLLIFPSHSVRELDIVYDVNALLNEAEEIANEYNYDTIVACFHYLDLHKEYLGTYKNYGCINVSAGADIHPDFMRRLKSIITLSDAVLVNSCTTGVVYAMYMNKSIFVSKSEASDVGKVHHTRFKDSAFTHNVLDIINERCSAKERNEWLDYYFGFGSIKTKPELKEILEAGSDKWIMK